MKQDAELLRAKVIACLERIVTVDEMRKAMELPQRTYYDQSQEGRLINLKNIKALAHNLGVNEIWLLTECGLISKEAIAEYCKYNSGESA